MLWTYWMGIIYGDIDNQILCNYIFIMVFMISFLSQGVCCCANRCMQNSLLHRIRIPWLLKAFIEHNWKYHEVPIYLAQLAVFLSELAVGSIINKVTIFQEELRPFFLWDRRNLKGPQWWWCVYLCWPEAWAAADAEGAEICFRIRRAFWFVAT